MKSSRKTEKVLGDYQKRGTTFVPPMLQHLKFEHISWASQTLPELVWWDVIMQQTSHRFAVGVAEQIGGYFRGRVNNQKWWAFISDFSDILEEDALALKRQLSKANMLSPLTDALNDFVFLYPECPLRELFEKSPASLLASSYLDQFSTRVSVLLEKRSRSAVLVQAQPVYMGFVIDKLRVKEGLALADFPEVASYPDTERSVEVGASVCATVNMLAGQQLPSYQEDQWVQYFWSRSLELQPLDFQHLEGYGE